MYQLILCTCPDQKSARDIAKTLLINKLAACINMLPNITSIYEWGGKVVEETEIQLLIKTQAALFNAVNDEIIRIHPYDTPEVIAIDISQGNSDYMHWLNKVTTQTL